jgi:hypothetical protein
VKDDKVFVCLRDLLPDPAPSVLKDHHAEIELQAFNVSQLVKHSVLLILNNKVLRHLKYINKRRT